MKLEDCINAGVFPNTHSVLILQNNKLVFEKYWDAHRDSLIQ